MPYQTISSIDDFTAVLDQSQSEKIVVFKHSSTCDLSADAKREVESVNIPVFELTVQTSRPLSNHIETYFGIRHESPQVIVIHHGKPLFNASHRNVTADAIHKAIQSQ
ncbi:MAG: bacillithiol system redox-active protein YtxJ [Bacteroidetes bacterium]|nr:bacillithiol system redox-active protein YtxJ [Bacteroidota bacterium]MCY4233655.1 bacillithiol system redox-active protein YtxJ [Bacteroidota bacterium]